MRGKLGLFLGLAAGAVLGFLFAPKPGSKLRAEINKERAEGGTGMKAIKGSFGAIGREMSDKVKKSKLGSFKKKLEDVIKDEREE